MTRVASIAFASSWGGASGSSRYSSTTDVTEAVALADRIVLLEDGGVALDVAINLPPHVGPAAEFGTLVDRILGRLFPSEARHADPLPNACVLSRGCSAESGPELPRCGPFDPSSCFFFRR